MQPRLWIAILTAALFAGGVAFTANADEHADANGQNQTKEQTKYSADTVLKKLHKDNVKEIRAGELALANAGSEPARALGEALVHDHSEAESVVKDLAKEHNVEFIEPIKGEEREKPDVDKDKKVDDLAALKLKSGEDFDRAFAKHMVKGHDKTIAMLENVKQDGDLENLHGLADQLLPVLKKHKEMAKDIADHYDNEKNDDKDGKDGDNNDSPKSGETGSV